MIFINPNLNQIHFIDLSSHLVYNQSLHPFLSLNLDLSHSLVPVRWRRHSLQILLVSWHLRLRLLHQVTTPQPSNHRSNLAREQPGAQHQHQHNGTNYHHQEVIGNFFNLSRLVGLQRHLLSVVDKPVMLMLIGDGGLEPGIPFNFGWNFQSQLSHSIDIDELTSVESFLQVIFLSIPT